MKPLTHAFSILIILLGTISLWGYIHKMPSIKVNNNFLSESIESNIDRLRVEQYDLEGKLAEVFNTPSVQHLAEKNIYIATNPELLSKKSAENTYTIKSQKAFSLENGNKIIFKNNVIMKKVNNSNAKAPIGVMKTQKLSYFAKQKLIQSTTGIVYDEGDTHLIAQELWVNIEDINNSNNIIIKGNTHTRAHYWSKPNINKPVIHAYAKKMTYLPKKRLIELKGDALVKQGDNTFSSPQIMYDLKNKHLQSHSNSEQKTIFVLKKSSNTVKL